MFKRVPAIANPLWEQSAAIYYTLEAMGIVDQYHHKVFEAFHKENQNLANPRIREEWLKKNGIDVAKYNDVAKSFSVHQWRSAEDRWRDLHRTRRPDAHFPQQRSPSRASRERSSP